MGNLKQGGVTAGQTITLQCLTHTQRTKASPTRQKKNFLITTTMDIASKNEFIYWMQRAVEDQTNDCYIELYNILLRAFVSADADFDGQVSQEEFGGMISAAAALPKKFAFDKQDKDQFVADCKESLNTASESYKKIYFFSWKCFQAADADRDGRVSSGEFPTMISIATAAQKRLGLPAPFQLAEEREKTFAKMDENGDGSIAFNEWLAFFLQEIIAPVAAL